MGCPERGFPEAQKEISEKNGDMFTDAEKWGGYLLFGVEDDGSVTGQQVSDDTLKNIANAVKLTQFKKALEGFHYLVNVKMDSLQSI